MNDNGTKKRGRPQSLTPDEREQRRIKQNKIINDHHKKTGYASRKKGYEPKIRVSKDAEELLKALCAENDMTITDLFVDAVEQRYGISLRHEVDKK